MYNAVEHTHYLWYLSESTKVMKDIIRILIVIPISLYAVHWRLMVLTSVVAVLKKRTADVLVKVALRSLVLSNVPQSFGWYRKELLMNFTQLLHNMDGLKLRTAVDIDVSPGVDSRDPASVERIEGNDRSVVWAHLERNEHVAVTYHRKIVDRLVVDPVWYGVKRKDNVCNDLCRKLSLRFLQKIFGTPIISGTLRMRVKQ